MSPPSCLNGVTAPNTRSTKIIPTFLSTDLVTPGKPRRTTLPAIGTHTQSLDDDKLWGQETKESSNGRLAYHHFKPSHFDGKNVVVSHRHFDNRIVNNVGKEQPCIITTLLLSKCRLNDQRMPPPLGSDLVNTHFIKEPIPEELRNSYFSHRCKHQVFPTSGVDLPMPSYDETGNIRKVVSVISTNTINEMEAMQRHLYDTTTYQQHFQTSRRHTRNNNDIRCVCKPPTIKGYRSTKNCRLTNAKIGRNQITSNCRTPCKCLNNSQGNTKELKRPDRTAHAYSVHKIKPTKSSVECKTQQQKQVSSCCPEFPVWPSYPPGNNIMNNPPNYPRVILPKYCIHMHPDNRTSCTCKEHLSMRQRPKHQSKKIATEKEPDAEPAVEEEKEEEEEAESDTDNKPLLDGREEKDTLSPERSSYKRHSGRGFKTDAHHRFHSKHQNMIPDLRDASKEGKRHNFFGYNAHVFRG